MNITRQDQADVVVLTIDGRVDTNTSIKLSGMLDDIIASDCKKILLDMEAVDHISSHGLRVILQGSKNVEEHGGIIVLCSLSVDVSTIFKLSGFSNLLLIYPNKAMALHELSGM